MARKTIKRSSLFGLIAVIALLSLGVGYAAWQDTITINGNVTTSTFDVTFDTTNSTASASDQTFGNCTLSYSDSNDTMQITWGAAYPGNVCTVNARLVNNGQAPAQMDDTFQFSGSAITNSELIVAPPTCDWDGGPNVINANGATLCTFTVNVSEANTNPATVYTFSATADFTTPGPPPAP